MARSDDWVFVRRVAIALGLAIVAVLILALIYFTFDVILLIFAGVLLAIVLRGLADILGRYIRVRDSIRVLLVAAILLGLLAGAVAGLAPSIADQATHLRAELPRSFGAAKDFIAKYSWGQAVIQQLPTAETISNGMASSGMLGRVGGIFTSTVGAIGNFLITILLAIYFAVEPRFYVQGFAKLFPPASRDRVSEIMSSIAVTLRWWLIGKAGSMLFIGILTWIGLSILGVPLALTLGLLAGLLSFIPNFGPILSAIPAILIAFVESPMTALYVVLLFLAVQAVESNIVTPLIERETIELPPGLTIIFQLALAVLVGGLGLVLATPILAVVMVFVQMVYMQDVLGDTETRVIGGGVAEQESEASGDKSDHEAADK
jgi:predicted PurR-regulated permease PerM